MSADLLPAPEDAYGCCMAAAFTGGEQCTCWEDTTEPAQQPVQEGPMAAPRRACGDCAYRAGSPERVAGQAPEFGRGEPFVCHQGMPYTTAHHHPSGAVIDVTPETDYQPITTGAGAEVRAWRADGRPADYCAGWAATHQIRGDHHHA